MTAILSKPVAIVMLIVALLAGAGLAAWRAAVVVERMIDTAAAAASAARDSHWKVEIEQANAAAARNIIAQMRASQAADLAARAAIDRLKSQISELERENEVLPDRDGSGIDRARARLLNNEPLADNPH